MGRSTDDLLIDAAKRGDVEDATKLLDEGADVNVKSYWGEIFYSGW